MIVALVLGLVLVAIPLYLWRRPRAESISISAGATDGGALPAVTGAQTAGGEEKLLLGDVKILSCHDPGPKRTRPDQCDHVTPLEVAFAKAIEESASCAPRDASGTIPYLADVNFRKRSVSVTSLKEGRTVKGHKIVSTCEKAVKSRLSSAPLESMKHEHSRYRLTIAATYPVSVRP